MGQTLVAEELTAFGSLLFLVVLAVGVALAAGIAYLSSTVRLKLAILMGTAEIALAAVAISGKWWDPDPWKGSPDGHAMPSLLYAVPFFVGTLGLWIAACLGGIVGAAIVVARIFRYLGQDLTRLFRAH